VARAQLGHGKVIQGNLDPAALLGPPDSIRQAASAVLRSGLGGPHVFNLGHGMMLHTPPDHVTVLVDTVLAFDRRAEHRPD
jgi:uroporphyrinogen decarboxylase